MRQCAADAGDLPSMRHHSGPLELPDLEPHISFLARRLASAAHSPRASWAQKRLVTERFRLLGHLETEHPRLDPSSPHETEVAHTLAQQGKT